MIGIPSIRDNDRFRDYRDLIMKAAQKAIGFTSHTIFVTPPTHNLSWPGVVESCNLLVEKCLREGWDYLWIIEADVQVPPDAFRKLLSLNVDIAQGYYAYHHDFEKLVAGYLDANMKIWYLPRNAVKGNILSGWVFAGLGCTLIKRRVFEDGIRFKHQPWTGCGHDVIFLFEAQKAGFVAKVHGDVECGHLPEWPFSKEGIHEELETLDVGCGDKPQGDVNCDVNVGRTLQGGDQAETGICIDPRKIRNFVRCDAHALPFRSDTFEKVTSFHAIEHIKNPKEMLKELIRVSKRYVEVRCPHALSRFAKMPFHIHVFEPSWFSSFLSSFSNIGFDVEINESHGKPDEIVVEINKRDVNGC